MEPAFDHAPDVDLHARKSRERLAHMVVALLDHWNLAPNDQAVLLAGEEAHGAPDTKSRSVAVPSLVRPARSAAVA